MYSPSGSSSDYADTRFFSRWMSARRSRTRAVQARRLSSSSCRITARQKRGVCGIQCRRLAYVPNRDLLVNLVLKPITHDFRHGWVNSARRQKNNRFGQPPTTSYTSVSSRSGMFSLFVTGRIIIVLSGRDRDGLQAPARAEMRSPAVWSTKRLTSHPSSSSTEREISKPLSSSSSRKTTVHSLVPGANFKGPTTLTFKQILVCKLRDVVDPHA